MPPLIYLAALLAGFALKWLLGGTVGLWAVPQALIAAVLIGVGILGSVLFRMALVRSGQDVSPRQPSPVLLTQGVYRISRNPGYLSLTLILAGLALALDNPWMLGLVVPTVLVMHYGVVLPEEAYLQRRFGNDYLRYRQEVRRWL